MEGKELLTCVGSENGAQKLYLQYKIIVTEDPVITDKRFKTVYSLAIIKSLDIDDRETIFIYDIARTEKDANEIAQILKEGYVTPCSVKEILDDIL